MRMDSRQVLAVPALHPPPNFTRGCKAQKSQRLRSIRHTLQGHGAECNAADGILMVNQGTDFGIDRYARIREK